MIIINFPLKMAEVFPMTNPHSDPSIFKSLPHLQAQDLRETCIHLPRCWACFYGANVVPTYQKIPEENGEHMMKIWYTCAVHFEHGGLSCSKKYNKHILECIWNHKNRGNNHCFWHIDLWVQSSETMRDPRQDQRLGVVKQNMIKHVWRWWYLQKWFTAVDKPPKLEDFRSPTSLVALDSYPGCVALLLVPAEKWGFKLHLRKITRYSPLHLLYHQQMLCPPKSKIQIWQTQLWLIWWSHRSHPERFSSIVGIIIPGRMESNNIF